MIVCRVITLVILQILRVVFAEVASVKHVQFRVAEAIRAGEQLHLVCDYDIEDALYSIKWYFEGKEFYRYVPKESPPTRVFPLPGIIVDISNSNEHEVTLNDAQQNLTGYYECEISADAPTFHTVMLQALVIIIEEPKGPPSLLTDKLKYSVGETVRANCTTDKAFPAPNITWYINEQLVNDSIYTKISTSSVKDAADFETVKSKLEFTAKHKYFKEGRMRIKCQASQFDLYAGSSEVELENDTPQLAHVLSPSSTLTNDHSDRVTTNKILFFTNLILTSKFVVGR